MSGLADHRCHVTKRKVSGGTRSDLGRDARDTFLGLAKTCTKLGIRAHGSASQAPPSHRLANLILARTQPP
jgi:hypothetical protein